MSFYETKIIEKTMKTNAPLHRVWDAWTDSQRLSQWFADEVKGWPGTGATLSMTWKKFNFTIDYEIAEIDPLRKLVLKTHFPGLGTQVLTLKFERRAPTTTLYLSEAGPENHKIDPKQSGVDSAWTMYLGMLKYYVEHQWAKPRKTFGSMLPCNLTFEKVSALYTTPKGLENWLCQKAEFNPKTQEYRWILNDGTYLSGKLLVASHHEVCYSCTEWNALLEFKSFPLGESGQHAICIRGSAWNADDQREAMLEQFAKDALVQLFAALQAE